MQHGPNLQVLRRVYLVEVSHGLNNEDVLHVGDGVRVQETKELSLVQFTVLVSEIIERAAYIDILLIREIVYKRIYVGKFYAKKGKGYRKL